MLETVAESPPKLLTVTQAALHLQVSVDTIRRWCRTGVLRCIALGDRAGYRISETDLVKFLEERQNRD